MLTEFISVFKFYYDSTCLRWICLLGRIIFFLLTWLVKCQFLQKLNSFYFLKDQNQMNQEIEFNDKKYHKGKYILFWNFTTFFFKFYFLIYELSLPKSINFYLRELFLERKLRKEVLKINHAWKLNETKYVSSL